MKNKDEIVEPSVHGTFNNADRPHPPFLYKGDSLVTVCEDPRPCALESKSEKIAKVMGEAFFLFILFIHK
jgi:hypothetical protein